MKKFLIWFLHTTILAIGSFALYFYFTTSFTNWLIWVYFPFTSIIILPASWWWKDFLNKIFDNN